MKQVYFASTLTVLFSQDALNYLLHKTHPFLIFSGKKERKKTYNFVLLTYHPLQLHCLYQQVRRGDRQLTIWSQKPVLAKSFFMFQKELPQTKSQVQQYQLQIFQENFQLKCKTLMRANTLKEMKLFFFNVYITFTCFSIPSVC